MTKIPCGGFYFDDSAFELTKQGEKEVLTIGGGIVTDGRDEFVMTSPNGTAYKITVSDSGVLEVAAVDG